MLPSDFTNDYITAINASAFISYANLTALYASLVVELKLIPFKLSDSKCNYIDLIRGIQWTREPSSSVNMF